MPRQKQGVRLPLALQKELGLGPGKSKDRRNGYRSHDERKATRLEKQRRKVRGVEGRQQHERRTLEEEDGSEGDEDENQEELRSLPRRPPQPKSILKKPAPHVLSPSPQPSDSAFELSAPSSRSSSPGLVLDANSRSYTDRQAEEDAEIAALEKRLGMKKGRTPKLFEEDGFGELLDGLDDQVENKKRKREDREWMERKRRRSMLEKDDISDELERKADMLDDEEDETGGESDLGGLQDPLSDNDTFSGFDTEEPPDASTKQQTKSRENPYVAPGVSNGKYIPPSLRRTQPTDGQNHDRLRRQLQGHLNKLSEANLISILNEVEKIYGNNPRQDVTAVLIDLLLSLFCNPASLQNTFTILHAAFITAIYKVIGTDFGAEILSKLVDRFAEYHNPNNTGKESLNLLSLLSNLFTFNLVSAGIIYDHIHILLRSLTESNTELLLRIIRDCGPQLRSDDPSALKSIVTQTQSAASDLSSEPSVRTKFMIETIMDLKNNKMRDSTTTSSLTKEHIIRMRKVLGSLTSRTLRATEPLRISLSDLQSSDRKGKWWLIGASWKGNDPPPRQHQAVTPSTTHTTTSSNNPDPHSFGLTTPLQQIIFTAINTSVSYIDAHARLVKLRLKHSQEPEIARVILRLCASEKAYNPFYAYLSKRLCSVEGGKRIRKTFDFALWAFFRRLGEGADDEDEDGVPDDGISVSEIKNGARLYAFLVYHGVVSLAVLKVMDLLYLKENSELFAEMLLVQVLVMCKGSEGEVERVFEKVGEAKQVVPRLRLFLRQHVRDSDLVGGGERKVAKKGYRVAKKCLERISGDMGEL